MSDDAPTRADAAAIETFAPGREIGRFILLREIGRGGMGSVFAAYDERLDRQVALKVVRPAQGGSEGHARLLREARALAQLSHPNVVAVYDAGEFSGHVFIAMELVAGETLRAWLRARRRPWREVVAVFVQACRGLAAAHGVGIVHRDFKPANVIVGADGRVRVLDFGLARGAVRVAAMGGVDASASHSSRSFVPEALTIDGAISGTPAYMAPEQLIGGLLDARTDVFAVCVSLYEALYGARPFGETLERRREELAAPRAPGPPRGADVPGWLRAAVLRGLAFEPALRHPSMDALIEALSRDPARRLRIAGLGLAAGLLVAGGYATATEIEGRACGEARAEAETLWPAPARARVAAAVQRASSRLGAESSERVMATLDDYANRWRDVHLAACRAHAAGEHAAEIHGLQTRCLGRRRDAFEALVERLATGDEAIAIDAIEAARELPAPERCEDIGALTAAVPPPDDPAIATEVEALRRKLAQARVALDLHRFDEGLAITGPVVERAEALGYAPLRAEALFLHGRLLESSDHDEEVVRALTRSLWQAERVRDDPQVAKAMADLIRVLAYAVDRRDEALRWRDHAEALIDRLGDASAEAAGLRAILGILTADDGRHDEGEGLLRKALADVTAHHGPDAGNARMARKMLASVLAARGRNTEALELFREHLARLEAVYGPEHPRLVEALSRIAGVELSLGLPEAALRTAERAQAIVDAVYGPGHPVGDNITQQRSFLLSALGRHGEALRAFDPLIAALERRGVAPQKLVIAINTRASLRSRMGDWAGSLVDLREAQRLLREAGRQDTRTAGIVALNMTEALLHLGAREDARAALAEARATLERHRDGDAEQTRAVIAILVAHLDVLDGRAAAGLAALAAVEGTLPLDDPAFADLRRNIDEATLLALRRLGRVDEAVARARRTLVWLEGKGRETYPEFRADLAALLRTSGR